MQSNNQYKKVSDCKVGPVQTKKTSFLSSHDGMMGRHESTRCLKKCKRKVYDLYQSTKRISPRGNLAVPEPSTVSRLYQRSVSGCSGNGPIVKLTLEPTWTEGVQKKKGGNLHIISCDTIESSSVSFLVESLTLLMSG